MTLRYVIAGALALAMSPATSQAAPVCVTHFYNQSNFQWSISNFDGKQSTLFIPPHTTLAISWGITRRVVVAASLPNRPFTQQFEVQQADSCVVLRSQNTSGPASPNKPGNGDITTCAGGC